MVSHSRILFFIGVLLVLGCVGVAAADGWEETNPNEPIAVDSSQELTDEEISLLVNRSMVRLEEVRDIEFEYRPDVRVLTREEAVMEREEQSSTDPADAYTNTVKRALFYVGDDTDANAARDRNRNATVGGYYLIGQDEIVLIRGEGQSINELTLAHELLHAWQDQQHDLSTYRSGETRDETGALIGLIEGDAVYSEMRYAERCESDWDCVIPSGSLAGEAGTDFSWGLYFADFHPYSDGPGFIHAIYERGGWEAVNVLYETPPTTTRYLIEPDTYNTFSPEEVHLPHSQTGGWELLERADGQNFDRLGPGRIAAMFIHTPFLTDTPSEHGSPPLNRSDVVRYGLFFQVPAYEPFEYAHPFTDGWAGDRFHAYERGNETAYVWRIQWESIADSNAFVETYEDLLRYSGAEERGAGRYVIEEGGYSGAYAVIQQDETVTIVNAPTERDLVTVSTAVPREEAPIPNEVGVVILGMLLIGLGIESYRRIRRSG